MKKTIVSLLLVCAFGSMVFAQTVDKKEKVKKTHTLGQTAHNTFSSHKHYNGYKVKTKKDVNGHEVKTKKKVDQSGVS